MKEKRKVIVRVWKTPLKESHDSTYFLKGQTDFDLFFKPLEPRENFKCLFKFLPIIISITGSWRQVAFSVWRQFHRKPTAVALITRQSEPTSSFTQPAWTFAKYFDT